MPSVSFFLPQNVYYISTHTESLPFLTQVMARILTHRLLRHCTPLRSPSLAIKSPTLIVPPSLHHHRHISFKPQLIEVDLSGSSSSSSSSSTSSSDGGGREKEEEEEEEAVLMQKLEEVVHRVMLQKSTPDWIPFIPGSSFWVPPGKKPLSVIELVEKLNNRLSDEETLALTTSRGWPSSFFYIHSQRQRQERVEAKVKVKVVEEEEEEEEGKGEVVVPVLDSENEEVGVSALAGSEVAKEVLADSGSKEVGVQGGSGSEDGKVELLVLVGSEDGEG